jgi:hypothetical protein
MRIEEATNLIGISRKLDVLDGLFLAKEPRHPSRITIRQHPENNPGHFQT